MKIKDKFWYILIGIIIGLWIGAIILSFYAENKWINWIN